MRIALVVYGGLDNVSGGFIYDRALMGALGARGHQVDVIALPWRGYLRALAGGVAARARPRALTSAWPAARPSTRYDAVIHDELVHPSILAHARRLAPGA